MKVHEHLVVLFHRRCSLKGNFGEYLFIIFAKSDSFQIIQWCCELFCFVFS